MKFKIGDRLQYIHNKEEKFVIIEIYFLEDIPILRCKYTSSKLYEKGFPTSRLPSNFEYDESYYRKSKLKKILKKI